MALTIPPVLANYHYAYGDRVSKQDKAMVSQFLAQIDQMAQASGLSRADFFSQLNKTQPELAQAYSRGGEITMDRPTMSRLSENLPWMLPTAGLALGAALPAAAGGEAALPANLGSTLGYGTGAGAGAAGSGAATAAAAAEYTLPENLGSTLGYGSGTLATVGSGVPAGMTVGAPAGANQAGTLGHSFWGTVGSGLKHLFGGGGGAPTGVAVGGDLLGAYLQSRAANKAAQQQMQFGQQALDFERGRYSDAQKNFAPYIATGQQAVGTMGSALMPASGPAPTAANLAPQFTAGLNANAQNNGRRMVQMRAPTGETQAVPEYLVPHYTSQGATVVG